MKKGNAGIVVLIITLLVTIIALCGVVLYYNIEDNNSNVEQNNNENTEVKNEQLNNNVSENVNNNTQPNTTKCEETVNKFVSLSIYTSTKKVVDNNRQGYYISKEAFDVTIEIRDGKVYFTKFLDNEFCSSALGIDKDKIRVDEKNTVEITGFSKKVVDAEICCYQTLETMYFVFLMEDGTLEYSGIKNVLTKLTTEGTVKNVSNIQRINKCAVGFKNLNDGSSMSTIIALDYENNMYDIGYMLNK